LLRVKSKLKEWHKHASIPTHLNHQNLDRQN
jgi:hypothetical protein